MTREADPATPYDEAFYAYHRDGALSSARVVVPMLLRRFSVGSAVDFGCGIGTWLRAFQENGVADIQGFDGDYVQTAALQIDPARFTPMDLSRPMPIARRFDLAVSLEVAEHLPRKQARAFVEMLVRSAPAVLFSAAIPGQGGVHHINEQWQDYWRAIFADFGYQPVDSIRPAVWGRPEVETWYQQNIVLYCDEAFLAANPALRPVPSDISLNMVHPALYEERRGMYLTKALKSIPPLLYAAIRRRVRPPRDDE